MRERTSFTVSPKRREVQLQTTQLDSSFESSLQSSSDLGSVGLLVENCEIFTGSSNRKRERIGMKRESWSGDER